MNLMQKYSKNCYNMAKYCHNSNSFDTDIQKNGTLMYLYNYVPLLVISFVIQVDAV